MNPNLAGIMALFLFATSSAAVASLPEIPPFQLNFMTMTMGFIVLTSFQLTAGKNIFRVWNQSAGTYAGVCGGIGVYLALLYLSFAHGPAFEINALNYLWPIFIVLLSAFIKKDKIGPFRALGSVIGFMGMGLLFIPGDGGLLFSHIMPGHILAVFAALCWAFYSVWARDKTYPVEFMAPALLLIGLANLLIHLVFESTVMPSGWDWFPLLFLGANRLSLSFWDFGVRRGDPLLLSSLSYFVPLGSTILMIIFGFHPENNFMAIGAFLIVVGCLIVNIRQILSLFRKRLLV